MDQKKILVGKLLSVHGLKGELQIELFSQSDSALSAGVEVTLSKNDREENFTFLGLRGSGKILASFEQLKTPEQAKLWSGAHIYLERRYFPVLASGEFYFCDLVGLIIIDEVSKLPWGKVDSFYSNGAQEILVLKNSQQVIELPWVDVFFGEINWAEKTMICRFPEVIDASEEEKS